MNIKIFHIDQNGLRTWYTECKTLNHQLGYSLKIEDISQFNEDEFILTFKKDLLEILKKDIGVD